MDENSVPSLPAGRGFRSYIKDIGAYGVVQQLLGLRSLIFIPLITKLLGIEDYGLYTLANVTAGLLVLFVLLSLSSGVVYKLPGDKRPGIVAKTFSSLLVIILGAWLILLLIMLSSSGFFVQFIFKDPSAHFILLLVLLTLLPDAIINLFISYFRIREETKRYLKYYVGSIGIEFAALVGVLILGGGVIDLLMATLVVRTLVAAVLIRVLVKNEGIAAPDMTIIKPYLVFCLPLVATNLGAWAMDLGDRYVIAFFRTPAEVGIYGASYNLPRILVDLNNSMWFVLAPVLARLWNEGELDEFRRYITVAAKAALLAVIPVGVAIATLADPLLTLLATPAVGDGARVVTPFIVAGNLATIITVYLASVFLFNGKTHIPAVITGFMAVLNIVLNLMLVPTFGIAGAAVATLATFAINAAVSIIIARRYIRLSLDWGFILRVGVASLVAGLFYYFMDPGPDIGLVVVGVVGIAIFAAVSLALGAPSREDRARIREAFFSR